MDDLIAAIGFLPPQYQHYLAMVVSIALALTFVAKVYVGSTDTPDPNTVLGKVYKVVEMFAVVTKKTKQTGLTGPQQKP